MKTIRCFLVAGLVLLLSGAGTAGDYKKLAQTGFDFLSVNSDGRASAMAGAVTALDMGSSALFFNPAGMARLNGFVHLSASNNKWIADIAHNTFSVALSPSQGRYGVFGFSLQLVDYGEVQLTRVADNDNSFVDMGTFEPSATAFGLGYARFLTDRFSVGGQIKYVRQDLGENQITTFVSSTEEDTSTVENVLSPVAFDFGTQFRTGIKSLVFGMSVRNFSQEVKFAREGFQLPLVFTIGISADLMDWISWGGPKQSLVLAVDANHDRSHPEQVMVGLDYCLMDMLALRGGYVSGGDEDKFSFGVGVAYAGIVMDLAYTPYGIFNQIWRTSIRFSM